MVLSRAAFGVRGNALPAAVSYLLLVGWEIVLVSLATLATATVFQRLGGFTGTLPKVLAFVVVAVIIVGAGVLGFDAIMKLQTWLTIALAVFTVGYIGLTVHQVDWARLGALPAGGFAALVGGFCVGLHRVRARLGQLRRRLFALSAAFGIRRRGGRLDDIRGHRGAGRPAGLGDIVGWVGQETLRRDRPGPDRSAHHAAADLVSGAVCDRRDRRPDRRRGVLDIYSSGLTLLTLGVKLPRWAAAGIDGVLMILGTIYVVWFAPNFIIPFQGFLITLGVPMAAWCGVFLADLLSRRRSYDDADLYRPGGRYGVLNWPAVTIMIVATVIGWGMVVNTSAAAFGWQGYLLGPLGLGPRLGGPWTYANLGVLVAFLLAAGGQAVFARARIRRQEAA